MLRMIARILLGVVVVSVILGLVATGFGAYSVRHSFPRTDGELRLAGLDGPVDIYRDSFGIPNIYAGTTHDLFFAQGYVHAQDRFWQMDFWRHTGSGRLAEMLGESLVETDAFLRSMGWARVVQQELAMLDSESLALLQAYADGVNAHLAGRRGSALSLEHAVLGLLAPGYRPEPWQPLHTLTWAKAMAWDLGNSRMGSEIQRAILLKSLTPEQLGELIPPYPADQPVIVPRFQLAGRAAEAELGSQLPLGAAQALEQLAGKLDSLGAVFGPPAEGLGSNSWVISGARTASGTPLLANDMHLDVQMPSIWYELGLHCTPKGPACPYQVSGYSFAGVPGVIVGHNDRIAWGFTNVGPDVIDLYIEKLNPENPDQYEYNGQWLDMQIVRDTIQVAGGEPVELTVRYTRHGPLISETYAGLEGFSEQAGISLPEHYAIAMRWTALEPTKVVSAILGIDLAQNWEDFRRAASDFAAPAQNMVYADVDGNIGYQMPGWIPIRKPGHNGALPVPGWTDEYDWQGYIPFEQLPFSYNPPQGYIATANNAVVGPEYPYSITLEWAYGYRAQRIIELIESAPAPVTMEYIRKMHGDNQNQLAELLVPLLLQLPLDDPSLGEARAILQGWDFQDHMDSAPSALFNAFWKHLLRRTFHDELPERYWPSGGERWFEVLRQLVDQPTSPWWDNRNTPAVETRDAIFTSALADAVAELRSALGRDPERWAWGDLHTVTFRNLSLGESGVAPIEALFNRGPYRASGGGAIINATGWDARKSYELVSLPSMRMIVDLSDLGGALSVNTTGQSGHPYHPHYTDQVDLWRLIEYHPMLWSPAQVQGGAEGHLRLVP